MQKNQNFKNMKSAFYIYFDYLVQYYYNLTKLVFKGLRDYKAAKDCIVTL